MAILSLDEAAAALGLTKDAIKELARGGTIRSFRAGNTLTFKSEDIEAYKESMPKAQAADAGNSSSQPVEDDFLLSDSSAIEPESPLAPPDTDAGSSFSLLPDDMDSVGIKVEEPNATTEMLSPSQMAKMAPPAGTDSPFELANEPVFKLADEEPAPAYSPSEAAPDGSSGVFQLSDDSSSEFEVGSSSEINVEPEAESEASFNLAPSDELSGGDGSASFAIEAGDSSSVFELDGSSQVDEASDSAFDIGVEDSSSQDSSLSLEDASGSEIMALDDSVADVSGSVDDIALEDGSGSEVVPVEEEGDINAGTLATPSRSGKATQLMMGGEDEDLEITDDGLSGEEESAPAGAMIAAPQPWGVVPVLFLTPAVLVMTALVFLTFEILLSSIGFFQGNKVSTVILKPMMDILDKDAAKLLN
jgi:excisionase family DNA binding protein